MTTFTVDISDKYKLAGLEAAKDFYNSSLTSEKDKDGKDLPITSHPNYKQDAAAYLNYVIDSACASYAKQFGYDADMLAQKEAEVAAIKDKLSKI